MFRVVVGVAGIMLAGLLSVGPASSFERAENPPPGITGSLEDVPTLRPAADFPPYRAGWQRRLHAFQEAFEKTRPGMGAPTELDFIQTGSTTATR